jgi:hypothetical protein
MPEFKFQIGQLVTLKTALADCLKRAGLGTLSTPTSGIVVERMSQECPGGVQLHYAVARNGETLRCNEIELISFDEVDVEEIARAAQNGRESLRGRDPFDHLRLAKDGFVGAAWFDAAAEVRKLADRLKALTAKEDAPDA